MLLLAGSVPSAVAVDDAGKVVATQVATSTPRAAADTDTGNNSDDSAGACSLAKDLCELRCEFAFNVHGNPTARRNCYIGCAIVYIGCIIAGSPFGID
jgi:hypothetical protein